jgi:hypothetical protein
MFERREEHAREIVEKFRQKGATSPDKAMTPQELDLPPRFEESMKRRLGRSGVFVEVNGKYYLSEERLKQIEQRRVARVGEWNPRKRIVTLRLIQLGIIVLLITLLIVNSFIQSWELKIVTAAIFVVWLLITILQIYYLSRVRKRISAQQGQPATDGHGTERTSFMKSVYRTQHFQNVTVSFVGTTLCS